MFRMMHFNILTVLCFAIYAVNTSSKNSDGSFSISDLIEVVNQNKTSSRSSQQGYNDSPSLVEEIFGIGGGSSTQHVTSTIDNESTNCSYYKHRGYECVSYYKCRNGEIITDGGGLIDIRFGGSSSKAQASVDPSKSKCPGYLDICCRNPNVTPQYTTSTSTTYRPRSTPPPPVYYPRCGQRNTKGVGVHIQNVQKYGRLNKAPTQFGEWPHMCAILKKKAIKNHVYDLYVGGASLIAPGLVLTAAHIVQPNSNATYIVRCGEWDTQQLNEPVKHQDRKVTYIIIHPEYNPLNLQEDFAILHIESDFILGPTIDTICLPPAAEDIAPYNIASFSRSTTNDNTNQGYEFVKVGNDEYSAKSASASRRYPSFISGFGSKYQSQDLHTPRCVATGWGKDKFGKSGEYQVVMKQVEMDLVSNQRCESHLRNTRLGKHFTLDDSFICAGGEEGRDTCKGDGGGPLVCKRFDGAYVQMGITAWGINCGKNNIPGVYARVENAICFIDWAAKASCRGQEKLDFLPTETFNSCNQWSEGRQTLLENERFNLQEQISAAWDPFHRDSLSRKYKLIEDKISSWNKASQHSCFYDGTDSQPIDLTGFTRTLGAT